MKHEVYTCDVCENSNGKMSAPYFNADHMAVISLPIAEHIDPNDGAWTEYRASHVCPKHAGLLIANLMGLAFKCSDEKLSWAKQSDLLP